MTNELNPDNRNPETMVIHLRPNLVFSSRKIGVSTSHLIEDPNQSRYFNIGSEEYRFACFLDGQSTLKKAFEKYCDSVESRRERTWQPSEQSGNSPHSKILTWDQVLELVAFFQRNRLLVSSQGTKRFRLFGKHENRINVKDVTPFGFKLHLFNADRITGSISRLTGWFFHKRTLLICCLLILWAGLLLLSNLDRFFADAKITIQPANWIWLAFAWLILKFFHEASHAVCCKVFGGKVGEAGIQLILLLPLPYMDVTDSWRFESRWKRIFVALAGVYTELIIASVCVFAWSYWNQPVLNSIAVNVIVMASATTLLFNLNPLMKLDGYYVLSDLLRRPNLATDGAVYQKNWLNKTFFGIPPAVNLDQIDLVTRAYGWLSATWRLLVSIGLLFAATKLFYGAGIVLTVFAIFLWIIRPSYQLLASLFSNNKNYRKASPTRCFQSLLFVVVVVFSLNWIPWPVATNSPGVILYSDQSTIRTPYDGFMAEIWVRNGQQVRQGDLLVCLENPDLHLEYHSLLIDRDLAAVESRRLKRANHLAQYQAELRKIHELNEQISIFADRIAKLKILAPHDGFVVADDLHHFAEAYFQQGDELLKVVATDSVQAVACVSENQSGPFRDSVGEKVSVVCESGYHLYGRLSRVEPKAIRDVIHPSLSAENGGPLPTQSEKTDDKRSNRLAEPVVKVIAPLPVSFQGQDSDLRVGQRCRIYLASDSRSVFQTITGSLSAWFDSNWQTH